MEDNKICIEIDHKTKRIPSPQSRKENINIAHAMGHFDVNNAISKIQEKYYQYGMIKDVKKCVQERGICLKATQIKQQPVEIRPLPVGV